ncbi:MAG: hypothetical protein GY791_14385 [Alphaproteobacteria bacterium]|nr:hypothetical protein [Alphaproteobacteria bacterium]
MRWMTAPNGPGGSGMNFAGWARLAVLLICATCLASAPARADATLSELSEMAEEIMTKGEPVEGFAKFAEALDVSPDDEMVRVIRAKHGSRLRMVWVRPVFETQSWDIFFADFRPEVGLLFLTDEGGELRKGIRMHKNIPPLEMTPLEAQPTFERERAFWLRWAR